MALCKAWGTASFIKYLYEFFPQTTASEPDGILCCPQLKKRWVSSASRDNTVRNNSVWMESFSMWCPSIVGLLVGVLILLLLEDAPASTTNLMPAIRVREANGGPKADLAMRNA